MNLIASPFESIEHAVIWLLIIFSVATWGLFLLKGEVLPILARIARPVSSERRSRTICWRSERSRRS